MQISTKHGENLTLWVMQMKLRWNRWKYLIKINRKNQTLNPDLTECMQMTYYLTDAKGNGQVDWSYECIWKEDEMQIK